LFESVNIKITLKTIKIILIYESVKTMMFIEKFSTNNGGEKLKDRFTKTFE